MNLDTSKPIKSVSYNGVDVPLFQEAPVLLWTNASPDSQFAAQTITLNGAGYSGYLIEFTKQVMTLCVKFGDANIILSSGSYTRTISNFTNTGVTFSHVNNTLQNGRMVPTRIFGIKFTL